MNSALSNPKYITDEHGHKTDVILPVEIYAELLEDLSDLAAVAERRDEATLSHHDLQESLKTDGIL